jgi:hypothetical protein
MRSPHTVLRFAVMVQLVVLALALLGCTGGGGGGAIGKRKALVLGEAYPMSHSEAAKINFLQLVNNPSNDPAVGWTCDLSRDLLLSLNMDPTNTTHQELFDFIGRKRLGYRIVMANGQRGATLPIWNNALNSGMMPFAPQGLNNPAQRFADPPGLFPAVSVAGGVVENTTSYGPGVEFIDALPNGDAAQSWANQAVAAKFAEVLDEHRNYNIWDGRAYLRQAASNWHDGWNETNGYGRPSADKSIQRLLPEPPVQFTVTVSPDGSQVVFTWMNFAQKGFAGTVIARADGRVIYNGKGTRHVWTSDVAGSETFRYWSRDNSGQTSPIQSYQIRTVSGLTVPP